ncbi:MAG: primosomal protein N', partial [Bacteroidales bacterium]|nr:primosomal protein N' [Bacteroidales bacterium]
PYKDLGLIIIDEEHDASYKQYDPAPRYNARDSAIYLARLHNTKTLLGSATPSLESYYNTQINKYSLVELFTRYGDISLPEVLVVDIKEESRKRKMKSYFSEVLLDAIEQALNDDEQIIIFQNRRGFSPRLECESCNWTPECKNCDVTLVYHKHFNNLRCHYCGYSTRVPEKCPVCSDTKILMRGFGTEKIEDELSVFFPDVKIARMDLDTTRSKNSYQRIITDFEDRKINILVGTQMVTKGLDFDNVSIVGVLNADNMINFPDFRSFERSFQILAQVSGRAGRKKKGKVIIQTYKPQHMVIENVIANNYSGMYLSQLKERQTFKYPPFHRLIQLKLKHKDPKVLNQGASELAKQLRDKFGKRVLGPEYPLVSRIKNLYLKNILIKIEKGISVSKAKETISNEIDEFKKHSDVKQVRVQVDVDPV